ncbi:hypothetical protein Bca4012_084833 [Brassica carinata]
MFISIVIRSTDFKSAIVIHHIRGYRIPLSSDSPSSDPLSSVITSVVIRFNRFIVTDSASPLLDPSESFWKKCDSNLEIGHSFCRLGFNSRTVILCDLSEKEFHVGCLKDHNIADLKELPKDKWFCFLGRKKINTSLGDLIVREEEKLSNNVPHYNLYCRSTRLPQRQALLVPSVCQYHHSY